MGHELTGENLVQIAQFCTILVGFLGIAVALRSHRRQMNAQMYIEFSARFQDVVRTMPVETWITVAGDEERIPPANEQLTRCALQWFLLLANLHQLHRRGYVSKDLWGPSQRGVKRMLQGPLLKREWKTLESAFAHDPAFCAYVQGLIRETHRPRNWRRKHDRTHGEFSHQ